MNYSLLPYSRTMHHMVRLRVTYNGKRIDIRTGIRVEPSFWDKKTQRVKRGFRYQEETDVTINAALISYVRFVNLYFIECERNFRAPVLTDLRDKFNYLYKHTGKLKKTEFFYLFEEFIKIKSGERGYKLFVIPYFRIICYCYNCIIFVLDCVV